MYSTKHAKRGQTNRRSAEFENRLLECTHLQQFILKLLKALVQKFRNSAEKFENRLLGPTIVKFSLVFKNVQYSRTLENPRTICPFEPAETLGSPNRIAGVRKV